MKIRNLDDCRQILSDAKTGVVLRIIDADLQILLDALEYALDYAEDEIAEAGKIANEASKSADEAAEHADDLDNRLSSLRDDVDTALLKLDPEHPAYEGLHNAVIESLPESIRKGERVRRAAKMVERIKQKLSKKGKRR